MHLLSRIGCTCITLTPCYWKYLWGCIHHVISYYTCHHTCISDTYSMIMHIGSIEEITLLEFNEEEEGDQQETPQAVALGEDEQDSQRAPWVSRSPTHLFPQRQAPEHYNSPMFYKILLESFMFDALGYKSWLETLDAWNYLVQIYTPLILCRSRIEYMLSHA